MSQDKTYMWQRQPFVATKVPGAGSTVPVGVPTWSRPASNVGPGGKVNPTVFVDKAGVAHQIKAPDAYGSARGASCKLTGRRSGFNPRPLKVWRKQLRPTSGSGGGRAGMGNPMDRPGGSSVRQSLAGLDADDLAAALADPSNCCAAELGQAFQPLQPHWKLPGKGERDRSHNGACGPTCSACNPEAHVIRRGTTVLSKTYYTDSRAYLRARGRRYEQNLGAGAHVPGRRYYDGSANVLYDNGEPGRANGLYGGLQCPAGSSCPPLPPGVDPGKYQAACAAGDRRRHPPGQQKPYHSYKPSNRQFAVQGAVESSTRLDRLKLNTIQRAAKTAGAFGAAARNASRYTGRPDAPHTVKSDWSLAVCRRVSQNKAKCCRMVSNKLGTAPASRLPHASTGQPAWCANSGRTAFNKNQELLAAILDDPDAKMDVPAEENESGLPVETEVNPDVMDQR